MILIEFLFVLFLFAVLSLIGWLIRQRLKPSLSPADHVAAAHPQTESAHLLARSVRLMETGLNDPMYRQSEDWSNKARQIVASYYQED